MDDFKAGGGRFHAALTSEGECAEEHGGTRRVQRLRGGPKTPRRSQFQAAFPYVTELPLIHLGLVEAPAWPEKQD